MLAGEVESTRSWRELLDFSSFSLIPVAEGNTFGVRADHLEGRQVPKYGI